MGRLCSGNGSCKILLTLGQWGSKVLPDSGTRVSSSENGQRSYCALRMVNDERGFARVRSEVPLVKPDGEVPRATPRRDAGRLNWASTPYGMSAKLWADMSLLKKELCNQKSKGPKT